MISVNQRSVLSCSGMLEVWCEMQRTLVLSYLLPPALTLLTLCLCPKGVVALFRQPCCFALTGAFLPSRHQGREPWIGQTTDSRVVGAVCYGRALSPAPWKLHSFALGLNILGTSTFQILWGHFISLREGQACRSHCLWIWIHFTFYLRKQENHGHMSIKAAAWKKTPTWA